MTQERDTSKTDIYITALGQQENKIQHHKMYKYMKVYSSGAYKPPRV